VVRFKENMGHGRAREAAIEMASGELVAVCDADDINETLRFAIQFDYLVRHPGISIVGSYVEEFGGARGRATRSVPLTDQDIKKYAKFRCPMNQMTVMFRRQDVLRAGSYKDFYHNEDYYLWIRMMLDECQFANIPKVLVRARTDDATIQRRGGWQYFVSEVRIQRLLLKSGMTNSLYFVSSILIRVVVQLLVPAKFRGYLFHMFFRRSSPNAAR